MPIAITCPACKFQGHLLDEFAGSWVRCTQCRNKFSVAEGRGQGKPDCTAVSTNALADPIPDEQKPESEPVAPVKPTRQPKPQPASIKAEKPTATALPEFKGPTITYTCPNCGTADERPEYMAGQKTVCAYCRKPIGIPKPGGEARLLATHELPRDTEGVPTGSVRVKPRRRRRNSRPRTRIAFIVSVVACLLFLFLSLEMNSVAAIMFWGIMLALVLLSNFLLGQSKEFSNSEESRDLPTTPIPEQQPETTTSGSNRPRNRMAIIACCAGIAIFAGVAGYYYTLKSPFVIRMESFLDRTNAGITAYDQTKTPITILTTFDFAKESYSLIPVPPLADIPKTDLYRDAARIVTVLELLSQMVLLQMNSHDAEARQDTSIAKSIEAQWKQLKDALAMIRKRLGTVR